MKSILDQLDSKVTMTFELNEAFKALGILSKIYPKTMEMVKTEENPKMKEFANQQIEQSIDKTYTSAVLGLEETLSSFGRENHIRSVIVSMFLSLEKDEGLAKAIEEAKAKIKDPDAPELMSNAYSWLLGEIIVVASVFATSKLLQSGFIENNSKRVDLQTPGGSIIPEEFKKAVLSKVLSQSVSRPYCGLMQTTVEALFTEEYTRDATGSKNSH